MLNTYFFIPANNKKFLNKIESIISDYFVLDLEDSVIENQMVEALQNLSEIEIKENYYLRPRLYNFDTNIFNESLLRKLLELGFKNYLIPKFTDINVIKNIKKIIDSYGQPEDEFKFILIAEHPTGIFNLKEAIESQLLAIRAIGFGSYDYCNIMNMKHTLDNIYFARQYVLNIAKAFNLEAIDIVSLSLDNKDEFIDEVMNSFSMGFDAKFFVHPQQLELLRNIEFYSKEEIKEAYNVYDEIMEIQRSNKAVVKINGKIYEKPHINRIINIINWDKRYGSK